MLAISCLQLLSASTCAHRVSEASSARRQRSDAKIGLEEQCRHVLDALFARQWACPLPDDQPSEGDTDGEASHIRTTGRERRLGDSCRLPLPVVLAADRCVRLDGP